MIFIPLAAAWGLGDATPPALANRVRIVCPASGDAPPEVEFDRNYARALPDAFAMAGRHLNPWLGFVNTIVLLTSSLTMAQAVRAARLGRRGDTVRNLAFTALLGTAFLGIKAVEYRAEYVEHLVPVPGFRLPAEHAPPADAAPLEKARFQLFFVHYFFMTGLHAIHLIIGVGLVSLIAYLCHRGWFSGQGALQVEITGLYWHFVDVVWVFLYPLLYLMEV